MNTNEHEFWKFVEDIAMADVVKADVVMLDAGKLADLGKQIANLEAELVEARKAQSAMNSRVNSGEVRLANMKIELTRLVRPYLDTSQLRNL